MFFPARLKLALFSLLLPGVLSVLLFGVVRPASADHAEATNVLVLSSFDQSLPWTHRLLNGLNSAQQRSQRPVELFYEFFDHRRLGKSLSAEERAAYLRQRYQHHQIDAVIVDGHYALVFADQMGQALFGDIPYVVIANHHTTPTNLTRTVQLVNRDWLPGNVELIMRLHAEASSVVLVGGNSEVASGISTVLEGLFKVAGNVPVERWQGMPPAELKQHLAALPNSAVVVFTVYMSDDHGQRYIPRDILPSLVASTQAPVYGLFDVAVGSGIVGGYTFSAERAGQQAFDSIWRMLENEGNVQHWSRTGASQMVFDQRALDRFGIDPASLPVNSEIRYRKPSLYEAYVVETISISVLVIVLLVGLVITLLLCRQNWRLLRRVERQRDTLESEVAQRTESLRQLAVTDQLTGLCNRAEFYRLATMQRARCRAGQSTVIALLDIDDFKQINDCYGHHAGDEALRLFGQYAGPFIKSQGGLIGRVGGEEFAAILTVETSQQAIQCFDALRTAIAALNVEISTPRPLQMTISTGLAMDTVGAADVDTLLLRADRQLYRAKDRGKNCVCLCTEGEPALVNSRCI